MGRMMARKILSAVTVAFSAAALLTPLAHAEQWAYAMQTGHGDHSIQVDVDSIVQRPGFVAARLLYEYYPNASHLSEDPSGPPPRSALVDGAFDCKGNRFQVLSRVEYAAPEAQGIAGKTTQSTLTEERWRPASADPETFAIIDWVCSVAAHKLEPQARSIP
jgi:hypothetical protein